MKLGVIMGGVSSEYEVSLNTGSHIIASMDAEKYEICPIEIKSKKELVDKAQGLDFAIIALHGKFGEDGTVQGTLDTMGIPYTGSGLISSALCMNKDLTKKLLRYEGVQTPDWLIIRNTNEIEYKRLEALGYPVVVKPNSGGSSVGTSIVRNPGEVSCAVRDALKFDNAVIIEQYIPGEEITCPILDGKLLPVLTIKPKAEFFSYSSKYDDGGAEENIAKLEESLYRQVEQAAVKCYQILGCAVYARVDMIVMNGTVYVLEVNTLPGMTKNSLFPKSARAAGITFQKLMELLIEYSLEARKK